MEKVKTYWGNFKAWFNTPITTTKGKEFMQLVVMLLVLLELLRGF